MKTPQELSYENLVPSAYPAAWENTIIASIRKLFHADIPANYRFENEISECILDFIEGIATLMPYRKCGGCGDYFNSLDNDQWNDTNTHPAIPHYTLKYCSDACMIRANQRRYRNRKKAADASD